MLRFASLLTVLMTFVALIPAPADGCAIAPRQGQQMRTTSEDAFIVFDEQTKTEHFIRTASFTGDSSDFGFLVPTPGKPEINEVNLATALSVIAEVTKPRVVKQKKYVGGFSIGCSSDASFVGAAPTNAAVKSDVSVVVRKRVGNLDVAVLQANQPQAVRDWLVKNGFNDRPELTDWLKAYTDGQWYLSAFKIAGDAKSARSTTVKMSFPTPVPFYPYREPSDARAARADGRSLKIHVLANRISTGTIGMDDPKPWPSKTTWAGLLSPDRAPAIFESLKINIRPDEAWYLTEFVDSSNPRPGTDELYFSMAKDQSPVERPPVVEYEIVNTTMRDTFTGLGLGILLFATAMFVFVKFMTRLVERKST